MLTRQGRRRMQRGVRGLLALGLHCDFALHSPWTRALETAALLQPVVDGETRSCAALARAPDEALLAEVRRAAEACAREVGVDGSEVGPRIALVGHQPWLTEVVAWLTFGERGAGPRVLFGKGSVAWLEGTPAPGGMVLKALLPGRVLRTLGDGRRGR